MSVAINIENVTKKYGNLTVVNGLSANINPGEFFTLLGPSGCGKTTLLRMIIGFNSIEGGKIKVDNKVVNNIPTNKRNMGMVFQNYAVFPHMTVYDNVAFGLKLRNISEKDMKTRVNSILKTVQIENLAERSPDKLSGGQQQRIALARAIVINPEVLLMDEPLSNLDAKLRLEMRNAIKEIQHQMNITTVYVTHDQEEALAVSDRIAVMNEGVIQQIDTPTKIYKRPSNRFVATFIGRSNLLNGVIKKVDGKVKLVLSQTDEKLNNYEFDIDTLDPKVQNNDKVLVAIRPEEFIINRENSNGLEVTVHSGIFLGSTIDYFLDYKGKEIIIESSSDQPRMYSKGEKIRILVNSKKINVFTSDGKTSLISKEVD